MNLIEKWKNRETKKKLREENIRLSERNNILELELKRQCFKPIHTIDYFNKKEIHTLKTSCVLRGEPIEYIKREIQEGLFDQVCDAIEYDLHDELVGKVYTGTLYVAIGGNRL